MRTLRGLLVIVMGVSIAAGLAGCGGGASSEENQVRNRLSQWLLAWETQNPGALGGFYRSGFEYYSYWFDEEDRDLHVDVLVNDIFPFIRGFRRTSTSVDMRTIDGLLVAETRANFTAEFYTDISAYDVSTPYETWAPVGGTIRQVWVRDSINQWVIAEEYFSKFWIRQQTPTFDSLNVVPDLIDQGHSVAIVGSAHARSTDFLLAIPVCVAASAIEPDIVGYEQGSISYDGEMLTRSDAIGGYGVYLYTEADPPVGDYMIGSNQQAVVLSVISTLARPTAAQAAALKAAKHGHTMGDVMHNRRPNRGQVKRPGG
jgi:hypothetical protein